MKNITLESFAYLNFYFNQAGCSVGVGDQCDCHQDWKLHKRFSLDHN